VTYAYDATGPAQVCIGDTVIVRVGYLGTNRAGGIQLTPGLRFEVKDLSTNGWISGGQNADWTYNGSGVPAPWTFPNNYAIITGLLGGNGGAPFTFTFTITNIAV